MVFDLHIHSHKSYDCVSSFTSIITTAARKGLRGIALTDHEVLASAELPEIAAKHNIWLIRGIEAKTEIGDILGLFLSNQLKSRKADSLIDEIHDQGGIAILAHPFKYMRGPDDYPAQVLSKLDAIEVINSRWVDLRSHSANPTVSALLSAVSGRSAGSDSHFPFEIGRALWKARVNSPAELKESICANSGEAVAVSFSTALDAASQCVKFAKKPTVRQFGRLLYRSSREIISPQRSLLK
jgi:predicted metal-dependent phosphoesterase TrpH